MPQILLEAGADPNASETYHRTALHYAVRHTSSPEVIRLLLEAGIFVNQVDSFGETALHAALAALARRNDAEAIVRMIAEAGGETVFPVERKHFYSNSERR